MPIINIEPEQTTTGGIWRYRFMLNGRRYFKALPDCPNKT